MRAALRRYRACILLCCLGHLAGAVHAQIAFEVASIKPSAGDVPGGRSGILPGGAFFAESNTLRQLVTVAYQLPLARVIGGPNWVDSERYDVTAKSAEGSQRSPIDVFAMLRNLLNDRFGLVLRKDSRDSRAFALVSLRDGELGPRLKRIDTKCDATARIQMPPPSPDMRPICSFRTGRGRIVGGAVTMAALTPMLQRDVGAPVVDRTGIEGRFDLDLEWAPTSADQGASIFTAMQEQLGLKLEPIEVVEEVLIIEKANRPTQN